MAEGTLPLAIRQRLEGLASSREQPGHYTTLHYLPLFLLSSSLPEISLRLSRACLGKATVFLHSTTSKGRLNEASACVRVWHHYHIYIYIIHT
eukprot:COSAG06_NODE_1126_length_10609_cov_228.247383_15_plen_93_part_00